MNSQIFNTRQNPNSNMQPSVRLAIGSSPAAQWLSAILFILAVILFPERPAWGDDPNLCINAGGIKEYAHQATLADVLEVPADEGGYTFPKRFLPPSLTRPLAVSLLFKDLKIDEVVKSPKIPPPLTGGG